jgi:hypothetical protein
LPSILSAHLASVVLVRESRSAKLLNSSAVKVRIRLLERDEVLDHCPFESFVMPSCRLSDIVSDVGRNGLPFPIPSPFRLGVRHTGAR